MNRKTILLVCTAIAAIAALAYLTYLKRFQIAAKAWHWRHGSSVIVSGYRIPVPNGWLVRNQTEEDVDLIATGAGDHRPLFANVIVSTGRPRSNEPRDLGAWKSHEEQFLENKGLKDVDERTLHFDTETVVCLGGYEARDIWRFPNATLFTLGCMSTSPLNFMYIGQKSEVSQLEAIISGIRKP